MSETILITGGAGLIGSTCCRVFAESGYDVVSVDNFYRGEIFGTDGDTEANVDEYLDHPRIDQHTLDIRDPALEEIVQAVDGIVHTAAQPSHPKSVDIPVEDFDINAKATLDLLETVRRDNDDIPFLFMSTNKVYGEMPNYFAYRKTDSRFVPRDRSIRDGFDESLRVDQNKHTPFGVSKLAADLYVQEYARLYGLDAGCFRLGCITGEAARAVELQNWEPYFVKLALAGETLTIFGYEGYQVRDVLHAADLAELCRAFIEDPRPAEVYNVGGGRENSVSLLEAIDLIEEITGKPLEYEHGAQREADHQWWISDLSKVRDHYPGWSIEYSVRDVFERICQNISEAPRIDEE